MRKVILTVGPMCAGKSTFVEKAAALDPGLVLVSRDAICMQMHGSIWIDNQYGENSMVWEKMFEKVAEILESDNVRILLDAYTNDARARRTLTSMLRVLGAERVEAWHFVTPVERCIEWYFKRERPRMTRSRDKDYYDRRYRSAYSDYHREGVTLEQGFDVVTRIDASTQTPEFVLSTRPA